MALHVGLVARVLELAAELHHLVGLLEVLRGDLVVLLQRVLRDLELDLEARTLPCQGRPPVAFDQPPAKLDIVQLALSQCAKGVAERRLAYVDRNRDLYLCAVMPQPGMAPARGASPSRPPPTTGPRPRLPLSPLA